MGILKSNYSSFEGRIPATMRLCFTLKSTGCLLQGKPGKVREKNYFWKSQGKQGENA